MKLKKLIEEILYGSRFKEKQFKDEESNYLLKNPSRKEIEDLVSDIRKDLRNRFSRVGMREYGQEEINLRALGTATPKKRLYIWDSYKGTHDMISRKFKIFKPRIEIEVTKDKSGWKEKDPPTYSGNREFYNTHITMLNKFYSLLNIRGKDRPYIDNGGEKKLKF